MKKIVLLLSLGYLSSAVAATPEPTTKKPTESATKNTELSEMVVTDTASRSTDSTRLFPNTAKATPRFTIERQEIQTRINATTVEDTLRYAPGVLVRKRYMGDPSGALGIRSSNSFQSAHSLVYADGMPLHNLLRTTSFGAPRWSMVSPNEIESSEVLYGPFSAQFSGNSMGGVIQLNTKMPEKFEAEFDATGMFQTMNRAGRNQTLEGFRTFVAAGNRFDKFSIWGSYNHFENQGQPQTINAAAQITPVLNTAAQRATQAALPRVIGGQPYQLPTAAPAVAYGDIGVAQPITDLFKVKMGYDFTEDLQGRFTFAYENRQDTVNDANSLLKNPNGSTNWGGATSAGLSANTTYYNPLFNRLVATL